MLAMAEAKAEKKHSALGDEPKRIKDDPMNGITAGRRVAPFQVPCVVSRRRARRGEIALAAGQLRVGFWPLDQVDLLKRAA